jgi:uncharacterized membrane protein YbaN (DUF454 family)
VGKAKRIIYITLGTLCVGLGLIGIVVPLMPTTVFLLMAAFFYSRSSDRFHDWLLTNRLFGDYIRNYREGRGMTATHKTRAILLLWVTIGLSMWMVRLLAVRVLLFIIASAVSVFLLWFVKTYQPDEHSPQREITGTPVEPVE